MSIRIRCVCGARLKAPEKYAGMSVRCSICGIAIFLPATKPDETLVRANEEIQAWIRVECECGKVIKVPPEWAGKKGHCPRCGAKHTMPTTVPSGATGIYEVHEVVENPDAKSADPSSRVRDFRKAQAAAKTADDDGGEVEPSKEALDNFAQSLSNESGLLNVEPQEDVKIVDGVAPAIWDAKRDQRAKAIKAGPETQADQYVQNTDSSHLNAGAIFRRFPAASIILGLLLLAIVGVLIAFLVL